MKKILSAIRNSNADNEKSTSAIRNAIKKHDTLYSVHLLMLPLFYPDADQRRRASPVWLGTPRRTDLLDGLAKKEHPKRQQTDGRQPGNHRRGTRTPHGHTHVQPRPGKRHEM